MTWTKWSLQQITLTCAASLTLIGCIDSFAQVQASHSLISATRFADQPTVKLMGGQAINRLQASLKFILPPPPNRRAPGRRKGAASRGECPSVNKPLTALVPSTEEFSGEGKELAVTAAESVLGLTTAEHPTFWFYVPYELTSERPVEFVLLDDQNNYVYKSTFTATGASPGIISFRLPSTATPLEFGKMYHWYFLVNCNLSNPVFVEGWIQRTTLSPVLIQQLEAATPRERVALYAANGIWHETLTTLAELYRAAPQDTRLAADWTTLLQAVDLDNMTSEPLGSVLNYQEIK